MGGGNDIMSTLGDDFLRINLSDIASGRHVRSPMSRPPMSNDPGRPGVPFANAIPFTEDMLGSMKETHSPLYSDLLRHSAGKRVDTDTVMTEAIRAAHPGSAVVVSRDYQLQPFNFPGVQFSRVSKTELLGHRMFFPPANRNDSGGLGMDVTFGCFTFAWEGHKFLMYLVGFSENVYMTYRQYFFVADDEAAINQFILASSNWAYQLHDQIPVYAHGWWEKSHELWLDVQKANWDDVILDSKFKKRVQDDIDGFFKSEQIYKDLAIPWKRGVIFLGPPGNGKTISIKAIMKASSHPSLLVRNFESYGGEEFAMKMVFDYARSMSPCILILEDLDSLINDRNRSYFLNEIDGLTGNDGLLVIGTTNHFDRLDPALSKRPSRFDRKFNFEAPNRDERVLYAKYWQKKLKSNEEIPFPDSFVEEIADLTKGFSFAFIKEAMVSSLVILANHPEKTFDVIVKEQIESLRDSIGDDQPLRD